MVDFHSFYPNLLEASDLDELNELDGGNTIILQLIHYTLILSTLIITGDHLDGIIGAQNDGKIVNFWSFSTLSTVKTNVDKSWEWEANNSLVSYPKGYL